MKYTAYESFVDYLFSEESKSEPYRDFNAYFVSEGDADFWKPEDGSFGYPFSRLDGKSIASSAFSYPSSRIDLRPEVTTYNGTYSESDKTYEEQFNIPARERIEESSYADERLVRGAIDSLIRGDTVNDLIEEELLLKKSFSEEEYDTYNLPLTYMNGDQAGLTAEDCSYTTRSITASVGCLLACRKIIDGSDTVVPVGFIDFENLIPCSRYSIEFDPKGIVQLK